jgi:hypothetical protein
MRLTQLLAHRRDLGCAADQRRRLRGQIGMMHIKRAERWEVGGKVGRDDLEDLLRSSEILEAMEAQVAQLNVGRQVLAHQFRDRQGE